MRSHLSSFLRATALHFTVAIFSSISFASADHSMSIDELAAYLEDSPDSASRSPDSWLSSLSSSDYDRALGIPELVLSMLPAEYPSQSDEYTYTISWHAYLFNARHLLTDLADVAVLVWIHDGKPVRCYPIRFLSLTGRKRYYEGDVSLPPSIKDGYSVMFIFKDGKVLDIPPSMNMFASSRWLAPDYVWEKLKEESPNDEKLSEAILSAARSGNVGLLDLALLERAESTALLATLDLGQALIHAVVCGQPKTTERLLEDLPSETLNDVKTRCIKLGLKAGNLDCLDILLLRVGEKGVTQSSAKSLFEIALSESNKRVFEYLLSKGLQPKFSKKEYSAHALQAIKKRRVDLARMLWDEYGANPSYTESGDNAVYHSAGYADVALLEDLKNRDLPIDTVNTRGYSPMHKACVTENLEALSWFIKRSPRFAHSFKGENNLVARSIAIPKPKTVEFLLEAGFDPNFQVASGVTLLDYARNSGREDIANILIKHGAR